MRKQIIMLVLFLAFSYSVYSDVRFTDRDDGRVNISSEIENEFYISLSGYVGENEYIFNPDIFTWEQELTGNRLIVNNSYEYLPIIATYILQDRTKITHEITNLLGFTLRNATLWYVITGIDDEFVYYNRNFYQLKKQNRIIHLKDQERGIVGFNGFTFNFRDVLEDYNISSVYIGNNSRLGIDELSIAIGIDLGDLIHRERVILDPEVYNSSQNFPSVNGSIHRDWANGGNLFADDNQYATSTTVGAMQTVSGFSILESEGGSLPDNHGAIAGVEILIESTFNQLGAGGEYDLTVDLSFNNGTTWTDQKYTETITGAETNFYGSYVPDDVYINWKHKWFYPQLSNDNFIVRFNLSSLTNYPPDGAIFPKVDYVTLRVAFMDGDTHNITYHTSADIIGGAGTRIYHLAPSGVTQPINKSNIVIYSNLDYDDTLKDIINMDWASTEGTRSNAKPLYITGSECISGGCLNFTVGGAPRYVKNKKLFYDAFQYDGSEFQFDNFTMCAWVKRLETDAYNSTIFDSNDDDYRLYLENDSTNSIITMEVKNISGDFVKCQDIIDINNKFWNHVCATYNQDEIALYRNSVLTQTCQVGGALEHDTTQILVGATEAGFLDKHYFIGMMDEILILDTALTGDEIDQLYGSYENITYDSGYLEYTSRDMGGNDSLNLSSIVQVVGDGVLNVSIGNKTATGYNYSAPINYSSGFVSGLTTSTPTNYSLKFSFYGKENSPYMNASTDYTEPFVEVPYTTAVDSCLCQSSQDCFLSCSSNCSSGTFDLVGYSIIISGSDGYYDITGNVTCDEFRIEHGCQLRNMINDGKELRVRGD